MTITVLNTVLFCSVTQLCLTLCDHMDCNTPGLPVHHQLLEFTKTHVHQVSDVIQPCHSLLSPSSCLQSFPGSFQMSQFFASVQFTSVQSLSRVWLFVIPCIAARQASLSITSSQSLLKLMPIELVMPSIRYPNYWSFNFSISLPMNIQNWFPLRLTGLISLQSKGLSRVFTSTTVQKRQYFSAQLSLWSNSHINTWLLEKPWLWLDGPLLAN